MHHVLRIGHRGAAGHAPENTLAAIQRGIELEADFVEIDVRCTADGVLVALHDATVNRTTNGKGRVDSLSLPEIRALDAGNGEHIPTLEQVLKVAAGKTGLMLELKVGGVAPMTVQAVQKAGFKDPVIYASFLHEELTHVRAVETEAALMVLFDRLPRAPVAYAMQYHPGTSVFGTTEPPARLSTHSIERTCRCGSTPRIASLTSRVQSPSALTV